MARTRKKEGASLLNDDIGFDLDRLFDPYNMDHIPEDLRLNGFKKRDLAHVKHYKAAVSIFGGPLSRKRVIIAPPMETPIKRRLGLYMNEPKCPRPVLNSTFKPSEATSEMVSSVLKPITKTSKISCSTLKSMDVPSPQLSSTLKASETTTEMWSSSEEEEEEKEMVYKKWYAERRALRKNLDDMGLNEHFLQHKENKSELERRVQAQLKAARLRKPESPPPSKPVPEEKEPPSVPSVKVPVPSALQILDKFLAKNKMRLVDLFRNADRNNDWGLTKDELQSAVKQYNIPLSNSDIDDLMVTLDHNLDELLNFKELAQGLAALKAQRRVSRRQESLSQKQELSPPPSLPVPNRDDLNFNQNCQKESASSRKGEAGNQEWLTANQVALADMLESQSAELENLAYTESLVSSRTSSRHGSGQTITSEQPTSGRISKTLLELPLDDLTEEQRVATSCEEMVELRKHNKAILARARSKKWPWPPNRGPRLEVPGVIRIGHRRVDNHSLETTLEGDMGTLLNQFRRRCLKEYFATVRACQEKGLALTSERLDRVLLYPPELPREECMKYLGFPRGPVAGLEYRRFHLSEYNESGTHPCQEISAKVDTWMDGDIMNSVRQSVLSHPVVRRKLPNWRKAQVVLTAALGRQYSPLSGVASLASQQDRGCQTLDTQALSALSLSSSTAHLLGVDKSKDTMSMQTLSAALAGSAQWDSITAEELSATWGGGVDKKGLSRYPEGVSSAESASYRGRARRKAAVKKSGKKSVRYKADEEKFWPGYMLDKLVLCEPSVDEPPITQLSAHAIFHYTGQKKRGNIGKVVVTGPVVKDNGMILKYGIDK